MNNEFLLQDRIQKIQAVNRQHNLLENGYVAFSGGKDSTVLHYLLDLALPGNKIPRVYFNTGIEYQAIVKYVKKLAETDDRINIYNSGVKIQQMLESNGYPFKSKEHAHMVMVYQHTHKINKSCQKYIDHKYTKWKIHCPHELMYQFTTDFKMKISDKCCQKLKKETANRWQRESGKTITMTGMRKSEGGERMHISGCVITDKDNKAVKFHPLLVVDEDWENWFIDKYNIRLCELYYPPYNFTRTGCKGCPFSLNLQKDLDTMEKLLPAEKKQCEIIWEPVYEEYRRIGYRLSNYKQLSFEEQEGEEWN